MITEMKKYFSLEVILYIKEGLNFASHLEITEIDIILEGDTYFPNIDWNKWKITKIEENFDKNLMQDTFLKVQLEIK